MSQELWCASKLLPPAVCLQVWHLIRISHIFALAHRDAASLGEIMFINYINRSAQWGRYLWMHNGVVGGFMAVRRAMLAALSDGAYNTVQVQVAPVHMLKCAVHGFNRFCT